MDQLINNLSFEQALAQPNFGLTLGLVFLTSVLGSLHCLGMCGGLAGVTATGRLNMGLYHLFRLLGYILVGFVLGIAGKEWIHALNKNLTSYLMIAVIGLIVLAIVAHFVKGYFVKKIFNLVNKYKFLKTYSGLFLGSMTALLPCGWLYAFFFLSFTLADPAKSVAVLFAFWLGTVPVLLVVQLGLFNIFNKIKPLPRLVLSLMIVVFGFYHVISKHSHHHHENSPKSHMDHGHHDHHHHHGSDSQ